MNVNGYEIKAGANLRGANLRGANLCNADLYGADLYDANLCNTDLCNANLYAANLRDANLYGANLRDANLRGADLYGADLGGADLYGADLGGANLRGADLGGANLRGADLASPSIIDAGQDPRGYRFVANIRDGTLWIYAGCRAFTHEQACEHWLNRHPDNQPLRDEIEAKLCLIESTVKARKWPTTAPQGKEAPATLAT